MAHTRRNLAVMIGAAALALSAAPARWEIVRARRILSGAPAVSLA